MWLGNDKMLVGFEDNKPIFMSLSEWEKSHSDKPTKALRVVDQSLIGLKE